MQAKRQKKERILTFALLALCFSPLEAARRTILPVWWQRVEFDRNGQRFAVAKYFNLNRVADLFFVEITIKVVYILHLFAVYRSDNIA